MDRVAVYKRFRHFSTVFDLRRVVVFAERQIVMSAGACNVRRMCRYWKFMHVGTHTHQQQIDHSSTFSLHFAVSCFLSISLWLVPGLFFPFFLLSFICKLLLYFHALGIFDISTYHSNLSRARARFSLSLAVRFVYAFSGTQIAPIYLNLFHLEVLLVV